MTKYTKLKRHLSERKAMPESNPSELELRPPHTGSRKRHDLIAEADRIRTMTAGPLEDSVVLLRRDRDSR